MIEQELDVYLRARCTLIVLVTAEEERAVQTVKAVCERGRRACLAWDAADGFQALTAGAGTPAARDPLTALEQIDKAEGDALFVLKDFHECWNNAQIKRKLRGVCQRLKFTKKSVVVTTPSGKVPEELKDEAVIIDFPPPSAEELEAVLNRLTKTPGVKVNLTKLGREKLVQAALGLTAAQAQRVFARAIVADGVLDDRDIDRVTEEKKQIIRESEALEFYPVTETAADVGGLGVLKEWLRLRERAFTQEARDYGLPHPRGIALVGIPGTGKSLTAKMIGGLWRLPLLRLDVGALFGSLVGESEERARRALRLAETVAPCLSGDARVTLADGTEQTIQALFDRRPEDVQVLGMTEQFQLRPVTVLGIMRRPAPDLYRVRLTHGTLCATSNHLHPVLRDGRLVWVRTDALTPEDHVAVPRQIPTSDRYPAMVEFLPADARLYAEGALGYSRPEFQTPQRKYAVRRRGADFVRLRELASREERPRLDEVRRIACGRGGTAQSVLDRLPERLNDEIGYVLGLITSDGFLGKTGVVGFVNTQLDLHCLFAEIMGRQFGLRVRLRALQPTRNDPPLLPGTGPESRFADCYTSVAQNRLARRILGEVRNRLLALPASFLRSWLRGHFDGDGHVSAPTADPKCTISAKVPAVNRLVRSVLHRVGFPTTNDPSHNIEITGLENVLRFIEEIGSSHPAKQVRMAAWRSRAGRPECKDRTDPIPVGSLLRSVRKQLGMGSQHFRATSHSLISNYERGIIHPNRDRLRSILGELVAWAGEHRKDISPTQALRALVDAPVLWTRVQSVGAVEAPEYVYDLICGPPHTFVANGIVTHNCILWVDELDKALAHGNTDSGTSTRVFGTILTWMQEKTAPVFVVATANAIDRLPPELLRKGRFDEIFFLDLPTLEERREILGVHLRKRKRLVQDFDIDRLARESEGYVGAEVEQAVIDAMYAGFGAGREFTTEDISAALKRQVPLSVSQRETIGALRAWLKEGRAQSASFQEAREAEQQFVPLQLDLR